MQCSLEDHYHGHRDSLSRPINKTASAKNQSGNWQWTAICEKEFATSWKSLVVKKPTTKVCKLQNTGYMERYTCSFSARQRQSFAWNQNYLYRYVQLTTSGSKMLLQRFTVPPPFDGIIFRMPPQLQCWMDLAIAPPTWTETHTI